MARSLVFLFFVLSVISLGGVYQQPYRGKKKKNLLWIFSLQSKNSNMKERGSNVNYTSCSMFSSGKSCIFADRQICEDKDIDLRKKKKSEYVCIGVSWQFVLFQRVRYVCGKGFTVMLLLLGEWYNQERECPEIQGGLPEWYWCLVHTGCVSWEAWAADVAKKFLFFHFVSNQNFLSLVAVQNRVSLVPQGPCRSVSVFQLLPRCICGCLAIDPVCSACPSQSGWCPPGFRRGCCVCSEETSNALIEELLKSWHFMKPRVSVWLWVHFYQLVSMCCSSFYWMTGDITVVSQAAVLRCLRWFVYAAVIHSSIFIS